MSGKDGSVLLGTLLPGRAKRLLRYVDERHELGRKYEVLFMKLVVFFILGFHVVWYCTRNSLEIQLSRFCKNQNRRSEVQESVFSVLACHVDCFHSFLC